MGTDVVIVGGGPSGSVCASLLSARGLRVTLIAAPRRRASWLELLSPEGVLLLSELGFEPPKFADSARACRGIVDTWGREAPAISDFELTRCSAGWVINRDDFDAALVEFTRGRKVCVVAGDASYRLTSNPGESVVAVESAATGKRIEAEFVVDTTGSTGRLMPVPYSRRVWFDRLAAVRVVSCAALTNPEWMRLSSSSSGWWYILPRADGTFQSVFMTDADLLPDSSSAARYFLERQFAEAFNCNPYFENDVSRTGFDRRSARTSCRRMLWSHHWMPAGDAAYSIDPIAGGGLTRAINMAEQTAAAVVGFLSTHNYDGLQHLAVERAREFMQQLNLLRAHYARAAEAFPNSLFWQRRREGMKRPRSLGAAGDA